MIKGKSSFTLAAIIALAVFNSACATNGSHNTPSEAPALDGTAESAEEQGTTLTADIQYDPYEKYNRVVFNFNMTLDRWLMRPVAVGYIALTPDVVETGIDNVFSNLSEVRDVVNDILQWKWKAAGVDSGRFVINSTVGLAGIFDVAKHAGLEESEKEDFGQTLATWGVPQGAYVVVPFLGSYTVSEVVGLPLDWELNPVSHLESDTARYGFFALDKTHLRSRLLETEELMTGDLYVFVRDAYIQRREYLVKDGVVEDDFGSFSDGEEEEFDF